MLEEKSRKATAVAVEPPADEIDELMRIKRSHRIDEGKVPCPACGVTVETNINRCPFCESDIAAETALARETNRRLREISGAIDTEHATRTRAMPKRRNFFQRHACLFQGDPEPQTSDILKSDPTVTRILGNLSPGDAVRVVAQDGPWLQVKTPSSEIGWVYSTFKKKV
jgi:hypothetical protein